MHIYIYIHHIISYVYMYIAYTHTVTYASTPANGRRAAPEEIEKLKAELEQYKELDSSYISLYVYI